MVLLPGCGCCAASCSIENMAAMIPSINVSVSTSGFSAGSPENGGYYTDACLPPGGGPSERLITHTIIGSYTEMSGSYTLTPATIPPYTTDIQNWPVIQGYSYRLPAVLGETTGYSVNPHVSLRFRCGTQGDPNTAGQYLWANAYVCLPIYTAQQTYTKSITSRRQTLTAVGQNQYGTGGNFFANTDFTAGALARYDDAPASGGVGDLAIYTGARPTTYQDGTPVGITKYVEQGDVIADHYVVVSSPDAKVRWQYAYFETGAVLVGEAASSGYLFYANAPLTSNSHRRTIGVSTRQEQFISIGWDNYGPNYNRFPDFVGQYLGATFISPNQQTRFRMFRLFGWQPSFSGPCGLTQFRSTVSDVFGQVYFQTPGTPVDSGTRFTGPTLTIGISVP